MSEETMAALGAALANDVTVRALFAGATTPEDVVRIAGEAGFVITAEEWMSAAPDLTDAELAASVGGGGWDGSPNWSTNEISVRFHQYC